MVQTGIMVLPALVACWFVLRGEKKRLAETSQMGKVFEFPTEGGGTGSQAA